MGRVFFLCLVLFSKRLCCFHITHCYTRVPWSTAILNLASPFVCIRAHGHGSASVSEQKTQKSQSDKGFLKGLEGRAPSRPEVETKFRIAERPDSRAQMPVASLAIRLLIRHNMEHETGRQCSEAFRTSGRGFSSACCQHQCPEIFREGNGAPARDVHRGAHCGSALLE